MSASLNKSTRYSSTNRTPTQVLCGFRTREALDLLRMEDPDAANPETTQEAQPRAGAASAPTGMNATITGYPIGGIVCRAVEASSQDRASQDQQAPQEVVQEPPIGTITRGMARRAIQASQPEAVQEAQDVRAPREFVPAPQEVPDSPIGTLSTRQDWLDDIHS